MIEIIPAIDLIDGKCVRLTKGDYNTKKIYNEDPLEVAKQFEAHGVKRLHLVDLDGAKSGRIINYPIIEKIAIHTNLVIDFGGGLKSDNDLRIAFESGAKMITGGSIAVRNPELFIHWLDRYGSDTIILGADAKDRRIAISGWEEDTELDLISFITSYFEKGIRKVISTDISKDGMLGGPSLALYKDIIATNREIYLIASGGVSYINDVETLQEAGLPAVIIGKAIYENHITLKELEQFIINN